MGFGPFLAGSMLLWGAVAAVPIALHFLRRRNRQPVSWAAMRFLRAAVERRSRLYRLLRLLLLALRVAAVLLLAAAVARPVLRETGATETRPQRQPTLHLFVLDRSYSMSARHGQETRHRVALRELQRRARAASRGDGFLLHELSERPEAVIERVAFDPLDVIREAAALDPTDGTASVLPMLELVESAVAQARGDAPWNGPIRVQVFSDLQQRTWQAATEDAVATRLRSLAEQATLELVDVGQGDFGDNVVVQSLRSLAAPVPGGGRAAFAAELRHGGGADVSQRRVEWFVNGLARDSQTFSLRAGESTTVPFETSLDPGVHAITVQVAADGLAADDRRHRVVEVPRRIRVVCIGPSANSTRFVAAALESGEAGAVEVRSLRPDALPGLRAADVDVIVLCDVGPLAPAAVDALLRCQQAGVGLCWWLGPNTRPAAVDAEDLPGRLPESVLPLRPLRTLDVQPRGLDPLDYAHRIVAPFAAYPRAGLLSTPIFRLWEVGPRGSVGMREALRVADGGPLLLTTPESARQRVVVITTAPAPPVGGTAADAEAWNAMIAWPSFVPLVQEVVRWALPTRGVVGTGQVGSSLSGVGVAPEEIARELELDGADERTLVVRTDRVGETMFRWNSGLLERAGVFRRTDGVEGIIAVNVDPLEGQLERLAVVPPGFQIGRLEGDSPERAAARPTDFDAPDLAASMPAGRELFRFLVVAVLALLCLESGVARAIERWAT